MIRNYYATLDIGMGWVGVLASAKGIRKLVLPQPSPQEAVEKLQPEAASAELAPHCFEALYQQLIEYFNGKPEIFSQNLDLDDAAPFFYVHGQHVDQYLEERRVAMLGWQGMQVAHWQ